jgi:hypothetical protein
MKFVKYLLLSYESIFVTFNTSIIQLAFNTIIPLLNLIPLCQKYPFFETQLVTFNTSIIIQLPFFILVPRIHY